MFDKAINDNSFVKCGIYGAPGTGKTTAAMNIAIGLHKHLKGMKLPEGSGRVLMADTEHGSSFLIPFFQEAGIQLEVNKTRAFSQLVPMIRYAEQQNCILVIDSLSHFWRELIDTYLQKRNRTYTVIADWNYLKGPRGTGAFNSAFVHSSAHIIWCAREASIFQSWQTEGGTTEMQQTGHKPRAETDAGHEPDLLMRCYSHTLPTGRNEETTFLAVSVVKDRSRQLMGQVFTLAESDPQKGMVEKESIWNIVAKHVDWLNLGGQQSAVTPGKSYIPPADNPVVAERIVVLDEIEQLLVKWIPGRTDQAKLEKLDVIERHFGVRSWKRVVDSVPLSDLRAARNAIYLEFEGAEYHPVESESDLPEIAEELGMTTGDKIPPPEKKRAKRKKKTAKK